MIEEVVDVARILCSKPDHDSLIIALNEWIRIPAALRLSQQDSNIFKCLVDDILPVHWPLHNDSNQSNIHQLLIESLSSLTAINLLLVKRSKSLFVEVLSDVISSDTFCLRSVVTTWWKAEKDLRFSTDSLLDDYTTLIAGGKVFGQVLQAITTLSIDVNANSAFASLHRYVAILGMKLSQSIFEHDDFSPDYAGYIAKFLDRALSLGECQTLVSAILEGALKFRASSRVHDVLVHLSSAPQSKFMNEALGYMDSKYFSHARNMKMSSVNIWRGDAERVSGAARVLEEFVGRNTKCARQLELWLVSSAGCAASTSLRRAVILILSEFETFSNITKRVVELWSNRTYMRTASTHAQESLTQTLLNMCAYVPIDVLTTISRGSVYVNGISSHLESTSDRVRLFGMTVGNAVSSKVTIKDKERLKFDVPDMSTDEALALVDLIHISDQVCVSDPRKALRSGLVIESQGLVEQESSKDLLNFTEIPVASEEDEDSDLEVLQVPDSDEEDSDDDPTLVDRDRLRAPVYMRDLIKMLNNHESFKHIELGLKTVPLLVRRKVGYGSELDDYAESLTELVCGLKDNFDMDEFQQLKQNALVSLVVSCPTVVCPYMARSYFTGDYSLQQRVIMLSGIGLGIREIAGATPVDEQFQNLQISKTLPDHVAEQFLALEVTAKSIQKAILQPMAVEARETLSGPDALKVRRFSKRPQLAARQVKKANQITPFVAASVFFPLVGHFRLHEGKMINKDASTFYEANLLAYFVRTLALIYQVSFGSTGFDQMTVELWDFLFSLRRHSDRAIQEAVLFGFLVLIDTNESRHLASQFSRKLVETQEWISNIFENIKEEKIQILSAGILIRLQEVAEKHQPLMLQGMMSSQSLLGTHKFGIAMPDIRLNVGKDLNR